MRIYGLGPMLRVGVRIRVTARLNYSIKRLKDARAHVPEPSTPMGPH